MIKYILIHFRNVSITRFHFQNLYYGRFWTFFELMQFYLFVDDAYLPKLDQDEWKFYLKSVIMTEIIEIYGTLVSLT